MVAAIFVLPNANAGRTFFTVSFGTHINPVQYVYSEWCNVATASPANGTASANTVAGASLATGAFTPGNNDANGGNLVFAYYAPSVGSVASNPSTWVSGGSFSLLDGNIGWVDNKGFPTASQQFVQTASASINPGITATGDTADHFNCVAVALKAASAGTPKPASGIYVNKVIHTANDVVPPVGNYDLQIPAVGNLRVLVMPSTDNFMTISGITDNDSGSIWVKPLAGSSQIWYCANRGPKSDLKVTLAISFSQSGVAGSCVRFFDVSNATTTAFDVAANTEPVDCSGATVVNNAPTITPTTTNGLVIACLALGQGPVTAFASGAPSGAFFDTVFYDGMVDLGDLMEDSDGIAHAYNAGTTTLNWNWAITNIASNNFWSHAVAFIAASAPPPSVPVPRKMSLVWV